MEKLRDNLWIWGHHAGAYHQEIVKEWNMPGENKMGPVEGAQYLGIPNCCRVVFNGSPQPPFEEETAKLAWFKKVIWSALGDVSSKRNNGGLDDLDEVIRQAEKFPNVVGCVLDDLFQAETKDARVAVERMQEMADTLHNLSRPQEFWIVFYASLLDIDYSKYLEIPDVVTFWSWTSEELANAEKNLKKIIALSPNKKHYAGCYLYNFGDCRELTDAEMNFQLDLYLRLWHEKKIDGVIVCSNNVVDVGINAPEIFRKWVIEHGDETR